jgi:AraC family transcriptional regulator, regulatory protein of adaptative response / DNA-3-methyladenine glycosylase II
LAGRFVAALGDPLVTPIAAVVRLFPTPQKVAESSTDQIGSLGIVGRRANAIITLAREVAAGRLILEPAADVAMTLGQLEAIAGIGRWTAQYIGLRALGWADAWPSGDVALIKVLGAVSARQADEFAEAWHPWRSYATLHLWRRLALDRIPNRSIPLTMKEN